MFQGLHLLARNFDVISKVMLSIVDLLKCDLRNSTASVAMLVGSTEVIIACSDKFALWEAHQTYYKISVQVRTAIIIP